MKRKVIRMADSTSLISLPKNWVHLNSISKGDELEIKELGNNLLIKGKLGNKISTIDLNDIIDKNLIWRYMVTSYRRGVDELTVLFNNEITLKEIQDFIGDLIGYAIVKQDNSTIIIKDIIQSDNSKLDETLRKVLSLLIDMSSSIYNGISKSKKENLRGISHSDYNINRFTNLFLRIINREGHLNFENTNSYYKIISVIEEIGDEYRRLAVLYDGNVVSDEILMAFKSINNLLESYQYLLFDFENKKLKDFYTESNRIKKLLTSVKIKNVNETRILSSLSTIFHLTKSLSEESLLISL